MQLHLELMHFISCCCMLHVACCMGVKGRQHWGFGLAGSSSSSVYKQMTRNP